MYKIIGADGKEYGPISADQLRQWIAEGRANAQTRILPEGAADWKPLSEFPEFASAIPLAPAPLSALPAAGTPQRDQVLGPAIGLMVTAIVGVLYQLTLLLFRFLGTALMTAEQGVPAWAKALSGTAGVITAIIGLAVGILIFIGALKMKQLSNYPLAMTASILAMIPCVSPCCWLGLPIGIWALVILSKPEVKSAFH